VPHEVNNNNKSLLSNFIELLPLLQANSSLPVQNILSLVWYPKLF